MGALLPPCAIEGRMTCGVIAFVADRADTSSVFRGDAKHRTRNLEIPGSMPAPPRFARAADIAPE
ncbi:MAG: hypothetical protein JO052_22400 [Bradyrhizobium sp.]|nr:hypothetical protein [Bradyrhizobium sp.]